MGLRQTQLDLLDDLGVEIGRWDNELIVPILLLINMVALFGKPAPSTGERPITLFAMLYRVWSRLSADEVKDGPANGLNIGMEPCVAHHPYKLLSCGYSMTKWTSSMDSM